MFHFQSYLAFTYNRFVGLRTLEQLIEVYILVEASLYDILWLLARHQVLCYRVDLRCFLLFLLSCDCSSRTNKLTYMLCLFASSSLLLKNVLIILSLIDSFLLIIAYIDFWLSLPASLREHLLTLLTRLTPVDFGLSQFMRASLNLYSGKYYLRRHLKFFV